MFGFLLIVPNVRHYMFQTITSHTIKNLICLQLLSSASIRYLHLSRYLQASVIAVLIASQTPGSSS